MPEVHIIGEIETATGFPSSNLFCKYKVVSDETYWEVLSGKTEGQTQDGEVTVFAHPIDLHYRTTSIKGWPKIRIQVWHQDNFGRNELYSYGFCHIPTSAGAFNQEIVTWRPTGTLFEEFKGGCPQLKNEELISLGEDRFRLKSITVGRVQVHLNIILKDFAKYGI